MSAAEETIQYWLSQLSDVLVAAASRRKNSAAAMMAAT